MTSGNGVQRPKVSLAPVKSLANLPADPAPVPTSVLAKAPASVAVTKSATPAKPVADKPVAKPAAKPAPKAVAKASAPIMAPVVIPVVVKPTPVTAKPVAPVLVTKAAIAPKAPVVPTPVAPKLPTADKLAAMPSLTVPVMGETLLKQQASAARKIGQAQALTLDHAVSELKAGLGEFEQLAHASSFSEALVIQARAFRRGQEAWIAHLGQLASLASKNAA